MTSGNPIPIWHSVAPSPCPDENSILVLAPFGQDAVLLAETLRRAGFSATSLDSMQRAIEVLPSATGVLLTTEALEGRNLSLLKAALDAQPPWSDLHVMLLTHSSETATYVRLTEVLGNLTILQRPLDSASLLTVVRTAIRARQKQLQIRDLLAKGEAQRREIENLNGRLLLALDTASLGTYRLDWNSQQMDSSSQCKANFGLAPHEELSFARFQDLILPEDREAVWEAICNAMETRSQYEAEYRVRWENGSLHWVSATGRPIYDEQGRPHAMLGVTHDITKRKSDEAALQDARDRLEQAVSAGKIGTFVWEISSNRVQGDRSIARMFGIEAEGETSLPVEAYFDRLHPADRESTIRLIREAVERGENYETEYRLLTSTEQIQWFATRANVEKDETGKPKKVAGVVIDITANKIAAEELERRTQEIAALNARLKRAMTETHHRVKNSLQLICAFVELQRNQHPHQVPTEQLKHLNSQVQTLAAVHDVLTMETKADGEAEFISSKALLEKLFSMIKTVIADRQLTYDIQPIRLTSKQGTSVALIANELVLNALKHSGERVFVRLEVSSGRAILTVEDDGPGLPPGFNVQQASNTGLALIENLARWDLQGETEYTNGLKGARISVSFPLQEEDRLKLVPTL